MNIKLLNGDCLEQMKQLPDNSVDSIVTDPPYGISFMSKKWDYDVPKVEVWKEAMRVLKHGGHALIACGTRTQHRMVVNIEDAGFEIRDVVSWIYGSGFPKSLNISKAIDKAAGAEREVVGDGQFAKRRPRATAETNIQGAEYGLGSGHKITAPATEDAKQWDGWGTALKPACEFFTLARKPLSEKTVAANVLKWGTGGINIDECRVGTEVLPAQKAGQSKIGTFERDDMVTPERQGRFPANLIHDGSQQVLELFPETKPSKARQPRKCSEGATGATFLVNKSTGAEHSDNGGSAARFFYCPKASKKDRDEGNNHPTVKPTALMQYLCRLITPTGGVVLDPYMGSGSTGKAAVKEGFSFVGCELDEDYYKIATARIETAK
jgi:site-specific DNA-methyltransferase (adenine-specific)